MTYLYFVMRGLSRASAVFAVIWTIGWCIDVGFGGWLINSAPPGSGRVELHIMRALLGAGAIVGGGLVLHFLWSIGGGDPYSDGEP